MALTIRTFQPEEADLWDGFVASANNGTIFHERKFLAYHPEGRFKDHSLTIVKNGKIKALFPAAEITMEGSKILASHPGSSYGGIVVERNMGIQDSYNYVELLVEYARSQGFNQIQMTLPPAIYQARVSNYLDFALIKHGFVYKKRDVSSILTIERTPEQNLSLFKTTHRTAVRKAIKENVAIRESKDWNDFYDILHKNLKIRHNVKPTHTMEEILTLKNIYPERIRLFGAYWNQQMVAGVVNFSVNHDVVLAFYISHDESFQQLRAVNYLFYEIIKWCQKNKFKYLDYGIFTVNMKPNFGLARFKENFGASGVFRDTFLLKF